MRQPAAICVGQSLALGYVRPAAIVAEAAIEVEIDGELRPARMMTSARFDPSGARMRG